MVFLRHLLQPCWKPELISVKCAGWLCSMIDQVRLCKTHQLQFAQALENGPGVLTVGHSLHCLCFGFQCCLNTRTQSETGHSHARVITVLGAMTLFLPVQTKGSPIPAIPRMGLQDPFPFFAKRRLWPGAESQCPIAPYTHTQPMCFAALSPVCT